MQALIIFVLLAIIALLVIYITRYLKQKQDEESEIERLNLTIALIQEEENLSKKLRKKKKIALPTPNTVVKNSDCTQEEEEDEQDVKDLISIQKKDLSRKSKTKRKIPVTVTPDNLSKLQAPEIASAAAVFDRPVIGYTISEPVISRVDMDAALTIIARLENNLSDCSRDALKVQSELRLELQKALEKQKVLEEENIFLKGRDRPLSDHEKQLFKEQSLSLVTLNTELEQTKLERINALENVEKLKEELEATRLTSEKKSKDWGAKLQTQQDSHNIQILALSSQLDSVSKDWKRKVDALEADLSRERYDNGSKRMQYQLLEMQCQKSEKDAFHAKTMIKQVLEEMRAVNAQNDKLKRQLSESFEFNVFAHH